MLIVRESVSPEELGKMSEKMYGGLVKAVVDIEQASMVVDAELHADEEALLIEQGSIYGPLGVTEADQLKIKIFRAR